MCLKSGSILFSPETFKYLLKNQTGLRDRHRELSEAELIKVNVVRSVLRKTWKLFLESFLLLFSLSFVLVCLVVLLCSGISVKLKWLSPCILTYISSVNLVPQVHSHFHWLTVLFNFIVVIHQSACGVHFLSKVLKGSVILLKIVPWKKLNYSFFWNILTLLL